MCMLFLLREIFGSLSIPNPISGIFAREGFGYVCTLTHISVITTEGIVWLFEYSYSYACY